MVMKFFIAYHQEQNNKILNLEIDRDLPFEDIADIRVLERDIAEDDKVEKVTVISWQLFE